MKLVRLTIHEKWGTQDYTGEVEFSGDHGKIQLHLNADFSRKVFELCGDALVASSKEVAAAMTATIIAAQTLALESPIDGETP